jgi:hypothetical protein
MTINSPLSATDLLNMVGPHTIKRRLSVVSLTEVAHASINMGGGITFPVASLTVNATSAGWANVALNQTVIITDPTTGIILGYTRARGSDSTHLQINESSAGDFGLLANGIQNRAIQYGDRVTVYDRLDVWTVLPRITYSGGVANIYEDYDATVDESNSAPGPINNILIGSEDGHYDIEVANSATASIAFDANCDKWPTSASVASYAWTIPGSWTVTAGATNAATFTATVPIGEYTVKLVTTDNNGSVSTSYRKVWVHDDPLTGTFPAIPIAAIESDDRNRTGRTMTIRLNGIYLSQIPDGAMVQVTETVTFNGTSISSVTRKFTGWVLRQDENSESGQRDASLTIVGPMELLKYLGGYSDRFTATASAPANWQQIQTGLNYADYLAYRLLKVRARGILQLFSYQRLGVSNLTGQFVDWTIPGQTLAAQLAKLAEYYRANIGAKSDGTIIFRRHPSRLTVAERGSVPVRMPIAASTWSKINTPREMKPKYRSVYGEGFYSDGSTTTSFKSVAYGNAPGQGAQDTTLPGLIVDSQTDLDWITGQAIQQNNNPYAQIPVELLGNFDFIEPAEMGYVALAVPAAYRPTNAPWGQFIDPGITLGAAIVSTSATGITVSAAVNKYWIIRIDSEQMLVTVSGTSATVTRGYNGTTAATHLNGAAVYRMQMAIPESISKRHNEDGTADITLTVEAETLGITGVTVPIPAAITNAYGGYSLGSALPATTSTGIFAQVRNDGGSVFAVGMAGPLSTSGHLYITTQWLTSSSPLWTDITGNLLSLLGRVHDFRFDPFSQRLISSTGALAAYAIGDNGLAYCANLLTASPVWTLNLALSLDTANYPYASVRPVIWEQGRVYVGYYLAGAGAHTYKALTDYGATTVWTATCGTTASFGTCGMDVDQYGSDEVLCVGHTGSIGSGHSSVYRIVAGVATELVGTSASDGGGNNAVINFIQKPLKTIAGANNSSTGGSEFFVYCTSSSSGASTTNGIKKTTDGGTSVSTLSPVSSAQIGTRNNSFVFTSDSSVLAMCDLLTHHVYTTTDGGTTWTDHGVVSNANIGLGFFPRAVGSSYGLYMYSGTGMAYSRDFGATVSDKTGNASFGFICAVIPLY